MAGWSLSLPILTTSTHWSHLKRCQYKTAADFSRGQLNLWKPPDWAHTTKSSLHLANHGEIPQDLITNPAWLDRPECLTLGTGISGRNCPRLAGTGNSVRAVFAAETGFCVDSNSTWCGTTDPRGVTHVTGRWTGKNSRTRPNLVLSYALDLGSPASHYSWIQSIIQALLSAEEITFFIS